MYNNSFSSISSSSASFQSLWEDFLKIARPQVTIYSYMWWQQGQIQSSHQVQTDGPFFLCGNEQNCYLLLGNRLSWFLEPSFFPESSKLFCNKLVYSHPPSTTQNEGNGMKQWIITSTAITTIYWEPTLIKCCIFTPYVGGLEMVNSLPKFTIFVWAIKRQHCVVAKFLDPGARLPGLNPNCISF